MHIPIPPPKKNKKIFYQRHTPPFNKRHNADKTPVLVQRPTAPTFQNMHNCIHRGTCNLPFPLYLWIELKFSQISVEIENTNFTLRPENISIIKQNLVISLYIHTVTLTSLLHINVCIARLLICTCPTPTCICGWRNYIEPETKN